MYFKRLFSIAVAASMVLALAACGKDSGDSGTSADVSDVERSELAFDEKTQIYIGVYSDMYYDSSHKSIDDNPYLTDRDTAQMQLDNVRAVEQRYNVEFFYKNLTWQGIIESINTSIMSGVPDCQMYDVTLSYGLPAILSGQCQALEDFLPEDDDIFHEQKYMKYLNVLNMDKNYLFASNGGADTTGTGLCFNMDIVVSECGLENPQDVYDRGEWTWDKWNEYLAACTYDKDGDGVTDVYGYGGTWTYTLSNLMLSNGASIASSDKITVTSAETIETLDFIDKMYNVSRVAKPWNKDDFMENGRTWQDGQVAFWPAQHWMLNEGDIQDKEWELGVVPFPIGPSGNAETNYTTMVGGDWMMIPVGVEQPETIYNMYRDYQHWYGDDVELINDTSWAEDCFVTERNFEYICYISSPDRACVDLWADLNADFSLEPMVTGEETAAQLAERSKNKMQKKLDAYLTNSLEEYEAEEAAEAAAAEAEAEAEAQAQKK